MRLNSVMNDLELVESKLLYDKQNIFTILKFKVSKFKIESSISIWEDLQYFDYAKQKCTWALK